MIRIDVLESIALSDVEAFGFNGFMTDSIYKVHRLVEDEITRFEITKETLENTYVKEWRTSEASVAADNETLKEGLSLGAYDGNRLVGFVIVSCVAWNKSQWIENIRIAEDYKGMGIAGMLLNHLIVEAKKIDCRLIGLEVMASNYPAVQLYLKHGYAIDGIDLSHYPTRPGGQKEVALFMKRYVSELI